jgi:hypothetical protein
LKSARKHDTQRASYQEIAMTYAIDMLFAHGYIATPTALAQLLGAEVALHAHAPKPDVYLDIAAQRTTACPPKTCNV